jgi:hypothetical protein
MNRYCLPAAAAAAAATVAFGLGGCSTSPASSSPPAARPPASTAPAAAAQPSATQQAQPSGTQVITYAPWASAGTLASGISAASTKAGSCFTNSSATNAPDAYRCLLTNSTLYDPCFADATSGAGEVACPTPANPDSVVVIKLTSALPAPGTSSPSPFPWLIVLANGQRCTTNTGTGVTLGGKVESYGCTGGYVYGQTDQSSAAWTVSYAPLGAPASAITQVTVTTAYEP